MSATVVSAYPRVRMHAAKPSSSRRWCAVSAGASVVVTLHTLLVPGWYVNVPWAGTRPYQPEVAMTATQTAGAVLPDGPSTPRLVQAVSFAVSRAGTMRRLRDRYGSAFTVESLNLGRMVMLADPAEVRELFQTGPELADTPDRNLGQVLGKGSFFAITGDEHRRQRKLLTPPFHGRRLRAYEKIIESETARETK